MGHGIGFSAGSRASKTGSKFQKGSELPMTTAHPPIATKIHERFDAHAMPRAAPANPRPPPSATKIAPSVFVPAKLHQPEFLAAQTTKTAKKAGTTKNWAT